MRGLSLTDVQVLPHYSRFLTRFQRFEKTCCEYEKIQQEKVIRINDGGGVIIDGEVLTVKGVRV